VSAEVSREWRRCVRRADDAIAKVLVLGLSHGLSARGPVYWSRMGGFERTSIEDAASRALAHEDVALSPTMRWFEDVLLKAAPSVASC